MIGRVGVGATQQNVNGEQRRQRGKRVRKHATMRGQLDAGTFHSDVEVEPPADRLPTEQHHSVGEPLRRRHVHHSGTIVTEQSCEKENKATKSKRKQRRKNVRKKAKMRGQLDAGTFHSDVEVEPPADLLSRRNNAEAVRTPQCSETMR